jgi:hypothetical protein
MSAVLARDGRIGAPVEAAIKGKAPQLSYMQLLR